MKKKQYTCPETSVLEFAEMQALLVDSPIRIANDKDYDEENVEDLRDENGDIWAD